MKMQSKLMSIGSKRYGIFGLGPWGYNKEKPQKSNNISIYHRTLFVQPVYLESFYHSDIVCLEFEAIFGSQRCY